MKEYRHFPHSKLKYSILKCRGPHGFSREFNQNFKKELKSKIITQNKYRRNIEKFTLWGDNCSDTQPHKDSNDWETVKEY